MLSLLGPRHLGACAIGWLGHPWYCSAFVCIMLCQAVLGHVLKHPLRYRLQGPVEQEQGPVEQECCVDTTWKLPK